MRKLLMLNFQ